MSDTSSTSIVTQPGGSCSTTGVAGAGTGYLSLFTHSSTVAGDESLAYGVSGTINMSSRYSGISVTTPVGYAGGLIEMSLAFDLSAALSESNTDGGLPSSTFASLVASVVVTGGSSVEIISESIEIGDPGGATCLPGGCGTVIGGVYTTNPFMFDPSGTLIVTLGLAGTTTVNAYFGGTASATVSASDTLSFSADRAFILPDGFSVTNSEIGVVDSKWIDPRDSGPAVVPLPASLSLLFCGFATLGAMSRRKREDQQAG